jgi:GT2 family glycosyltransferase
MILKVSAPIGDETGEPHATRASLREVAVVIPTCLRPALLARVLEALARQTLDPARFEIIVCDDGCDDATHQVVRDFTERHRQRGPSVVYLPVPATRGPAGARNRGWQHAGAAVIAFTDDDTVPDRRWLELGLHHIRAGADAVAGRIDMPLPADPTEFQRQLAGLVDAEFVTANCFVRRDALVRLGGFDERYTFAWREDSDLQFALIESGATIARADDTRVLHPLPPSRFGAVVGRQRRSQFDALLYAKHPRLYRARIEPRPPLRYYAQCVAMLVCIGALLAAWPALALLALAIWAWLTAVLATQRLRGTSHTPRHVAEIVWTSIAMPPLAVFWRLYGAVKFRTRFL